MSKKSKQLTSKKISLVRTAMNPDVAYAFQLAIKLQYVFPKKEKPELQIFVYDEEAKSGEWEIYGAHAEVEFNPDRVARINFSTLNEIKEFQLAGLTYRIQFTKLGETEIDYPRGGKTVEPVYKFVVESLKKNRTPRGWAVTLG